MAIAFNTPVTIANATTRAGDQTNTKVAALANGSYVVAWDSVVAGDTLLSNVRFQIFSAAGTPVGSVKNASAIPLNNERLQDIVGNADGTFTLAYTSTGAVAPGTAPTGYAGIGTFTQIGVVRNFTDVGGASGSEVTVFTSAGPGATEEIVNSMVLQREAANSNTVYFTQRDQGTLTGTLYKSLTIGTLTPPGIVSSNALKTYTVPPAEILVLDSSRQTAGNDLLTLTGRFLFSDSPASEKPQAGITGIENIAPNLFLATRSDPANTGVTLEGFQGVGNAAALYLPSGSIRSSLAGLSSSGDVAEPRIEALGGGRFIVVFRFDGGAAADGLFAVVYNANTFAFEGRPTQIFAGGVATVLGLDLAVLGNGRVAVTAFQSGPPTGNDIVTRVLDASDGTFDTGTEFSSSGSQLVSQSLALSVANDTVGVRVDLENSTQSTGPAAAFGSEIFAFTHIIGGSGADSLFGNSIDNILKGALGNDTLSGRVGNDDLSGGDGDDTLSGGTGNDLIDGGIGNDTVRAGDGFDTIFGRAGADRLYGDTGGDTINGDEGADLISGGDGNDTIFGGADNDIINGGTGNDIIDAGPGVDFIVAGQGDDIIDGGAGIDRISYSGLNTGAGGSGAYIDLSNGAVTFDGAGAAGLGTFQLDPNDTLIGIELATGSFGNDVLIGSIQGNRLAGGAGNDILWGRTGADVLTGDAGNDFFRYDTPTEANDTIGGFDVGFDKLQIASEAFADTSFGNISARLIKNSTGLVSGATPQFILNTSTGQLSFDADGTGGGVAAPIALIKFGIGSAATFSVTEFVFF